MSSVLGNIFPVTPRHAESADARLDIRRHDPDQEQRKKNQQEKESDGFNTEDSATVSVEALHSFLVNFLKSQEEESKKPETHNTFFGDSEMPEPPVQAPPSAPAAQNARAASAYQTTAQKTQAASFNNENTGAIAEALQLGAEEIRTIHILLEDMKDLSARHIAYITIERSTSFLQSLVDAVARAKNS